MSRAKKDRRTTLTELLERLRGQIDHLRRDPARWATLRAAEIEAGHVAKELAELNEATA